MAFLCMLDFGWSEMHFPDAKQKLGYWAMYVRREKQVKSFLVKVFWKGRI